MFKFNSNLDKIWFKQIWIAKKHFNQKRIQHHRSSSLLKTKNTNFESAWFGLAGRCYLRFWSNFACSKPFMNALYYRKLTSPCPSSFVSCSNLHACLFWSWWPYPSAPWSLHVVKGNRCHSFLQPAAFKISTLRFSLGVHVSQLAEHDACQGHEFELEGTLWMCILNVLLCIKVFANK